VRELRLRERAQIKFCGECGKPLSEASKLATSPDPRSYTPKHLAEKILTSRSALEGERKQVTVLFADVKGSVELSKQLGPEQWHGIMDGFLPNPRRRCAPLRRDGPRRSDAQVPSAPPGFYY